MNPEQWAFFMDQALDLARQAEALGEIPVGALVVKEGEIIGRGFNRRETDADATAHAEMLAIRQACQTLGNWRLTGCTLFVTLEPCPMCMGAILNSRIPRVVYGAPDAKAGCCGSVVDLAALPFNHHPRVEGGLLEAESAALLAEFFAALRARRAEQKALGIPTAWQLRKARRAAAQAENKEETP